MLQERLQAAARQLPQPEVHIRGDARADFEAVGRVVYACQTAGITRIGEADEVAALVEYVLSPAGRLLQGSLIDIDGGQTKSI